MRGVTYTGEVRGESKAPLFIHANWRASSTWFWGRFRQLPMTMCYFEPFNDLLATLTRNQIVAWDYKWWDSGHPPDAPYCLEYLPLIRRSGGARLFCRAIPYDWYIPRGGLRGNLREEEIRYLALLFRHASRREKIPVLGFTNSLGRISPLKKTFGGLHVFQYRNLWQQWVSYIRYKRRNTPFFYESVATLVNAEGDPYICRLREQYLQHAVPPAGNWDGNTPEKQVIRAALLSLPEHLAFGMFMGLHIYLYLHAHLVADMVVDVTQMARDTGYRSCMETELQDRTGLAVSFHDVKEEKHEIMFDAGKINWAEIRKHGCNAALVLAEFGDVNQLKTIVATIIDSTFAELEPWKIKSFSWMN